MQRKGEPAEADPRARDADEEARAARPGGSGGGTPSWAAIVGIVLAVGLVLLLVVLHLTGVLGPGAH